MFITRDMTLAFNVKPECDRDRFHSRLRRSFLGPSPRPSFEFGRRQFLGQINLIIDQNVDRDSGDVGVRFDGEQVRLTPFLLLELRYPLASYILIKNMVCFYKKLSHATLR